MKLKDLIPFSKEKRDRARYDALVDQGGHEGGLTKAESDWMREYWLKNIAEKTT